MNAKLLLIGVFFCNAVNFAIAQTNSYPNKEFTDPRSFVPATPDAAGLFNFSEFSVDYSSGSVNNSIPLFTAQSGRIKLPVSINYNSNGIRVQQLASAIGLGWNLNFGYSISVTEEEPKPLVNSGRLYKDEFSALAATNLNSDWMNEMKRAADGYYKTFYPVYSYKCGETSGMFYYDEHNNDALSSFGNNFINVKIEKVMSGAVITSFKITTTDGIEYTFDKKETSLRVAQTNAIGPVTTSFLCSKIRDTLTGDEIGLTYTQVPTYTTYIENSILRWSNGDNLPSGFNPWSPESALYNVTRQDVSSWMISRIDYKDGYANFELASDRLDPAPMRIKSVTVYSRAKGNFQVSKVEFNQSYFQTSGGSLTKYNYRLRLDGVTFDAVQYPSYVPVQNYNFTYNTTALPPYRVIYNSREQNANCVDYWGYYNGGAAGGNSFLSSDVMADIASAGTPVPSSYSSFGTNRKTNPNYTTACILTKVKYPTKGVSVFEYEPHAQTGSYLGDYWGGTRIRSIKYYENEGQSSPSFQKTFKYLTSTSMLPAPTTRSTFFYNQGKGYIYNINSTMAMASYSVCILSSDPLYEFATHRGSPLFYNKVEEYNGTETTNIGKTVYTSNFQPAYYAPTEFIDMAGFKYIPDDFSRGEITAKEIYKNTGVAGSLYEKVSQEVNTYSSSGISRSGSAVVGFGIRKNGGWDLVGPNADSWYSTKVANGQMPKEAFKYNNFYLSGRPGQVLKNEVSTFANSVEFKTTTDYGYNSADYQLASITTTNSRGQILKKELRYVNDKATISDVDATENTYAFNKLISLNKFNDVIEEKTFLDGVLIDKRRDRYAMRPNPVLGTDIPVISTNEITNYLNSSSKFTKQSINAYSDGLKILSIQRENGAPTAFLYDDYDKDVIAEVANASNTDIRYTSFEPGATGKWILGGSRSFDVNPVSGDYIYNLSASNTLSSSGLNSTKTYIVSYWSKNGQYTVAGTTSTTSFTTAWGWTYFEHKVTGQSIVAITGSGLIDEVRLYPSDAQMTSYCYDPMCGVRSKVDSKNFIIHYKYDGFRRLIQVVDQNHSIVKAFDYHYKN